MHLCLSCVSKLAESRKVWHAMTWLPVISASAESQLLTPVLQASVQSLHFNSCTLHLHVPHGCPILPITNAVKSCSMIPSLTQTSTAVPITPPCSVCSFPANTNSLIPASMYGKLAKEFPNLRGVKNTFQDTPLAKQFKDAAPDRQAR